MAGLETFIFSFSRKVNWVAGGFLPVMVAFVCVCIIARYFGHPIRGSLELVRFMAIIVVSFAVAYTQVKRGHIAVGIVMDRLPQRFQAIVDTITTFLLLVLSAIISWRSVIYAIDIRAVGSVSASLGIPFYLLIYGVAFGFAVLTLVFLVDFLNLLTKGVRK